MADFFLRNFIVVFFFYGLAFFSMGLAIWLELGHTTELEFARSLRPLAVFGLIHGSHEWFEMFLLIHDHLAEGPLGAWIFPLRIAILAISFLMLIAFGLRLIAPHMQLRRRVLLWTCLAAFWGLGLVSILSSQPLSPEQKTAADVFTRYSLAIPGAFLTTWGLILQRRRFIEMGMKNFGQDVLLAAAAFSLYGGVGQLFSAPSSIFPSSYLNNQVFLEWFGFPVQVLRAAMAAAAAFFIIRSMRVFEVENASRLEALRQVQWEEHRRLESLRAELLHRTVRAQESERQRIARELHDDTGQTLTALSMGLRGIQESITEDDPQRAIQQAQQLEGLAASGVQELQNLVSGLHPPQLDDLGLGAALHWLARDITERFNLPIQVILEGDSPKLPIETRISLYRIVQEAINNTLRHAQASQAIIYLNCNPPKGLEMYIRDDGGGFDLEKIQQDAERPSWGLLGMQERAALIGGTCKITSRPGQGTQVTINLPPLKGTTHG